MLTSAQIKRKLKECSKDELIAIKHETIKTNKDARSYVSVKLEGEPALLELLDSYKEGIRKEFYPNRGFPKLRVVKIEQAISENEKGWKGNSLDF